MLQNVVPVIRLQRAAESVDCRIMNIVVANSVLLGREAFSTIGEVEWLPESEITAPAVRSADAVITRTKTRLNASLLAGSRVRFAATCTAGTDHMDLDWMEQNGIAHASAPGCNAEGVAQYFTAAALHLAARTSRPLAGATLGIVGHGHVGKKVEAKALALGMKVVRNDPPLAAMLADASGYSSLPELLQACDLVTLHVPLVEQGPHPTRRLIGPTQLDLLQRGAWLINACRGEVLDGPAAAERRRDGRLGGLVLDVWDPEPEVPMDVLAAADLGTAHIAGHSLEGRLNGTAMAYQACCRHFGREPTWHWRDHVEDILLPAPAGDDPALWVRAVYDIAEDDRLLREACHSTDKVKAFRILRDQYRIRREFNAVQWDRTPPPAVSKLGFA
jgi:erythronate-4-phosphate dehydrogenase